MSCMISIQYQSYIVCKTSCCMRHTMPSRARGPRPFRCRGKRPVLAALPSRDSFPVGHCSPPCAISPTAALFSAISGALSRVVPRCLAESCRLCTLLEIRQQRRYAQIRLLCLIQGLVSCNANIGPASSLAFCTVFSTRVRRSAVSAQRGSIRRPSLQ